MQFPAKVARDFNERGLFRAMDETFYRYPPKRDVLFVLGAGASAPDGVPLQGVILPRILQSTEPCLAESEIGRIVRDFMDRWFPRLGFDAPFPTLEEVFGFLDTLIRQQEGLPGGYGIDVIQAVRAALIKCIHHVVQPNRDHSPGIYRRFWETVAEVNRNVSILSLNHDSTLEEAFDPLYPHRALIDYRIPFMNFDDPEGVHPFNWWINAAEPFQKWLGSDPIPIKVIKLHGSLNWKYCHACREVLLTPWDTAIDLQRGEFMRIDGPSCFEPEVLSALRCPYCAGAFDTLILPPSHLKNLSHPVISQLINEATKEVRRTKRIVFVGYSFPEADVHIRALLARSIRTDSVVVVDPGLSDASIRRYQSLSPGVRFMRDGFEGVVQSNQLEHLLRVGGDPD